jgi:D-glycero-D-manno-heptose 1,7-bisphosphate phosphatase
MNDDPRIVLFDRDGTLVERFPHNGNPGLVILRPGARAAVDLLRERGFRLGLMSDEPGVGRGVLTTEQVRRVNTRVAELLGPFDDVRFCPHLPEDGCGCRRPAPGMVHAACAALGTRPASVVVVGDTGVGVETAAAAGATPILVPTALTRPDALDSAPLVATDLVTAARLVVELRTGTPV